MFMSLLQDEPQCWYELAWDEASASIALRVHQDVFKDHAFRESPIVRSLREEFKLGEFECDGGSSRFGFNAVCSRAEDGNEFVKIGIDLPYIKEDEKCDTCNGTGRDEFYNDECRFCGGTGKTYRIDYKRIFPLSATVRVLTVLVFSPVKTSCLKKQLMTVETGMSIGLHGGSLGAGISPALARWIASNPNDVANLAVRTMQTAWRKMMGKERDEFASYVGEGGRIHISCPGNACGLDPEFGSLYKDEWGYELAPHNVDTPQQQLVLLAALAAIYSEARRHNV